MIKRINILFLLLAISFSSMANSADTTLNKSRLRLVVASSAIGYTASMIGLGTVWYDDYGPFRFFNDNNSWAYMDKIGHFTTAQHLSRAGISLYQWTGLERKKAIWYGGTSGLLFLTSVEVFDGFSNDFGFSIGDMIANVSGTALAIGQELKWEEQRILTKWSYSSSPYAKYRPELLGRSSNEKWLKDYNGQTYWLSFNLESLFFKNSSLPEWLNAAIGYGIDGYTGGSSNPAVNEDGEAIPFFSRNQQFYLSPDIDFSKIPTKSKFIHTVLETLNFIKLPAPALEYHTQDKLKFNWLFF